MHENRTGSTSGSKVALLELVLDNAATGSEGEEFLACLAALEGPRLSRPDPEVTCGITLYRRRKPASTAGSGGDAARSSLQVALDLDADMQSRTIIDMAVGAIMSRNRCQRDIAFKIRRNTSNNRNLKIRDVAAAVIAGIAGDTDMSARFDE